MQDYLVCFMVKALSPYPQYTGFWLSAIHSYMSVVTDVHHNTAVIFCRIFCLLIDECFVL